MSLRPVNPPEIVREYGCAALTPAGMGDRSGEKIWEGKCAGLMIHSWPNVNQTLEIRDKERSETMNIIPVPGKPIHFGTIRSVELRTAFRLGLLVNWRIVLEAFIDPIFAIIGQSAHGNAQWLPLVRAQAVQPAANYSEYFYAWEDGILRYAFNCSAGTWVVDLMARCIGGNYYSIAIDHALQSLKEKDVVNGRVTKGRYYELRFSHDDLGAQTFSIDFGIIKDPIDQT